MRKIADNFCGYLNVGGWQIYHSIDFKIENKKVTLTFSVRQDEGTNGIEHQGARIL